MTQKRSALYLLVWGLLPLFSIGILAEEAPPTS